MQFKTICWHFCNPDATMTNHFPHVMFKKSTSQPWVFFSFFPNYIYFPFEMTAGGTNTHNTVSVWKASACIFMWRRSKTWPTVWSPRWGLCVVQIPRDSSSGKTAGKTSCKKATSSCQHLHSSPHLWATLQTPVWDTDSRQSRQCMVEILSIRTAARYLHLL